MNTIDVDFSLVGRLKPLAHHPDCNRYDHHLIYIINKPFCLGCFSMATGSITSLLIFFVLPDESIFITYFFPICLFLIIPTFLQPFIQKKLFKVISRSSVGFASGFYFLNLVVSMPYDAFNIILKLLLILFFILVTNLALFFRSKNMDNPCENCPYGIKPFCLHYLHEYESLLIRAIKSNDLENSSLLNGIILNIKSYSKNPDGIVEIEKLPVK